MRSRSDLGRRLYVLAATALVAAVAFSGCSTLSPTDPWEGSTGTVEGTVTSDKGASLEGIQVHLWGEVGSAQTEVEYSLVTDTQGSFIETDVDLGDPHSSQATYEVYVNCTKSNQNAINQDYGTCVTMVTVTSQQAAEKHVVLDEIEIDDPYYPNDMIE